MDGLDYEQDTSTPRRPRGGDRRLLGLLLIGLGTVWFLSESNVLALSAETVLSGLLILLALGLIYSARWGRQMGRWPVLLGVGLTFALVANSPSLHFPRVRGGVGEKSPTPQTIDQLLPDYEGGFGNLTLDLTQLQPKEDLEGQTIHISMGAGRAAVIVPPGIPVDVVGRVRFGHFSVCGQDLSRGFDDTEHHYASPLNGGTALNLVIDSTAGEVSVTGCEPGTSTPVTTSFAPLSPPTPPTPPTGSAGG